MRAMMTRGLAAMTATLALSLLNASGHAQTSEDPWTKLNSRTGWILLGEIDVPTQTWAVQLKHASKAPRPPHSIEVNPGDVLRITENQPVVILNYTLTGEMARLQPPPLRGSARDSLTGVTLPPGSEVVVRAVVRDEQVGRLQGIWVRVEPLVAAAPRPNRP
jgi:hypothetical protein